MARSEHADPPAALVDAAEAMRHYQYAVLMGEQVTLHAQPDEPVLTMKLRQAQLAATLAVAAELRALRSIVSELTINLAGPR